MKVALSFVLAVIVVSVSATQWEGMKNPMDSVMFSESRRVEENYEGKSFSYANPLIAELEENTRTGRIVNGTPAKLGDLPYQVYMISSRGEGSPWLCGGSIIHKRWILTAAHCFIDIVKVEVYFGAITRYQNVQGSYIKAITVTRSRSIIMHPMYSNSIKSNDIALLELPEDAPIENSYVGLINLPKGSDRTRSLIGLQATVSGFGRVSDAPSVNAVLNYVTIPIVGNNVCSDYFGSAYVTSNHVCLQNDDRKSGCNGDSGGPLTITGNDGNKVQVGIVSYGAAVGCEKNQPQVLTKVAPFVPWIEETTGISFT